MIARLGCLDRNGNNLSLGPSNKQEPPFIGGIMTNPIAKGNVLDGIEENIKTTEEQIYQLKMQFASLMLKGISGGQ